MFINFDPSDFSKMNKSTRLIPLLAWMVPIIFTLSCQPAQNTKETDRAATAEVTNPANKERIILFFGNSITAGYNLDLTESFPALIQNRLDSLGYSYQVVNAGLSGETSGGGLNRIEWVLQRTVPDIFVLELGANDGLRGLDLTETASNLDSIIQKVRQVNPEVQVVLAGMMVPPNLGGDYTSAFAEIFPALAKKTNATLIPFLLESVAGEPDLNLEDGIHPNVKGHQLVAETVWKYLQPLLAEKS